MNTEKERELFEQWVFGSGLSTTIENGLYRSHVVGWMWHAWLARANLCKKERK